jgi:mannose-6-phosphate isomerase-like protein (cupin superfamily)
MLIDFNKISENITPNFRGGEKNFISKVYADNLNKIMLDRLEPEASIGMHSHDTNSEIIYIISGNAKCLYDDTEEILNDGSCHYCPKGHSHSLINLSSDEDLVFFAIVPEQ